MAKVYVGSSAQTNVGIGTLVTGSTFVREETDDGAIIKILDDSSLAWIEVFQILEVKVEGGNAVFDDPED